MNRHIRPVARANGIHKPIGWHIFRHSFGTMLKANGEDVVDIIVSNAGFPEQASLDSLTPEHFDKTFNFMARAPGFLVQKLLP